MLKPTELVKSILQLLVYAIIGWFLYTVRGLIVYIIVASLLALITKPIVNFISQKKVGRFYIPRAISSAFVILSLAGMAITVSIFLAPKVLSEFAVLSTINFDSVSTSILDQINILKGWLSTQNLDLKNFEDGIRNAVSDFFSIQTVENTVSSILGGLGNVVIALFSITFILFFLLKEKNITTTILSDYLSEAISEHIKNIMPKIKKTIFRYSLGLLIQMTGIFTLVFIGLSLANVESALVIALFAAFINLIPYIGPMIGAIFGLVLGLGQAIAIDPSISIALLSSKIVLVFAITQLTDNFVYQPLIFSTSINAHPLEIFIIISIAGLLGGVFGMIIAVPAYSMIRIVIKEFFIHSRFVQSFTKNV